MADSDDWSTDANEAIKISIVRSPETNDSAPTVLSTFHPRFTYPIFGDEERIFGYKGLSIHIRFAEDSLKPNVQFAYAEKFKVVGSTKATNLRQALQGWMPHAAFQDPQTYSLSLQRDASGETFKPPGELVHEYTSQGRNYEIWSGLIVDPAVREMIDRVQVLISFFIEGGTPINLEDQNWTLKRWKVFFVFEVTPSSKGNNYSFVGYSTTYRFWTLFGPDSETLDVKSMGPKPLFDFSLTSCNFPSLAPFRSRLRLSQFLILPSHQGQGHGKHLYNCIYRYSLSDPSIIQFTVEDPNEAFDDLRDVCDFTNLTESGLLPSITLNPSPHAKGKTRPSKYRYMPNNDLLVTPNSDITSRLQSVKLAPRQQSRIIELHLLDTIPIANQSKTKVLVQKHRASDENDRRYYWWRMMVKQRIYRQHRDQLVQLDHDESIERLEETANSVEDDYKRLLEKIKGGNGTHEAGKADGVVSRRAKRKVVESDSDEDTDESQQSAKKTKV